MEVIIDCRENGGIESRKREAVRYGMVEELERLGSAKRGSVVAQEQYEE